MDLLLNHPDMYILKYGIYGVHLQNKKNKTTIQELITECVHLNKILCFYKDA